MLGWFLTALALFYLGLFLAAAERARRTTATPGRRPPPSRLGSAAAGGEALAFVLLMRLAGPWDALPGVLWAVPVAALVWGAVRLAPVWRALPARSPQRVSELIGVAGSAVVVALAAAALVVAVPLALAAGA